MPSDWFPGRVTQAYRDHYDKVFSDVGGKHEDQESNCDSEQVGGRVGMSEMCEECSR